MSDVLIERRLSWAGGLIAAGLLVELFVSAWVHPIAFVTFAVVACPLVIGGVLMFLWSLLTAR